MNGDSSYEISTKVSEVMAPNTIWMGSASCDGGELITLAARHHADLLEECEIVFQMPLVRDPPIAHAQDVGCDEIHRLAGTDVPHESAGKMPREAEVRDHAVVNYQPLHHGDFQVWHRGEETLGRLCRPTWPLGAAGRKV